jgi:nicotinate-nucleotide adenylyltransferase
MDISPADRLDMLSASIPADPRITIDDCEIKREGVSYTIDTIADIVNRYRPEGKPGLVLGDDLVQGFSQWRQVEAIVARTDIIIAHRLSAGKVEFPYPYKQLDNEIVELSSALIRSRIEKGEPWRYLVPEGARLIIEDRGLYGYTASGTGPAGHGEVGGSPMADGSTISRPLIARVETMVRSMVSPSRFLHSRGVAALSSDLCIRYGLEGDRGYLAGIAHDMAKSLPEEELRRLARKDTESITKLEQKKPSLLHAKAAAVLLREWFGITDGDILAAVRDHTMGSPEMGSLAKILYIADKIDVSRVAVKPELRDFSRFPDLDSLFTAVLDETVAYLRSRQMDLSEGTVRLLQIMHNRGVQ